MGEMALTKTGGRERRVVRMIDTSMVVVSLRKGQDQAFNVAPPTILLESHSVIT